MRTLLRIGDDELDLERLPPMTLGTRSDIYKATKLDSLITRKPDEDAEYILFMLRKLRPGTTMEEVRGLSPYVGSVLLNAEQRITKEFFNPTNETFTTATTSSGWMPLVGQGGKNVIWWPTPPALVDKMLDMAQLTPQDKLIDLGSGDGRIVFEAARRGAVAVGVDANPDFVEMASQLAVKNNMQERASFFTGDFFDVDLSGYSVISLYLLPDLNIKLRPRLLKLPLGTRIVSHQFDMGNWMPDETYIIGAKSVHLWVVK